MFAASTAIYFGVRFSGFDDSGDAIEMRGREIGGLLFISFCLLIVHAVVWTIKWAYSRNWDVPAISSTPKNSQRTVTKRKKSVRHYSRTILPTANEVDTGINAANQAYQPSVTPSLSPASFGSYKQFYTHLRTKDIRLDKEKWNTFYREYIASKEWKDRALAAKRRVGFRCQICNNRGTKQLPLEAHHRTYDKVGDERVNDITVLCHNCHHKHHH